MTKNKKKIMDLELINGFRTKDKTSPFSARYLPVPKKTVKAAKNFLNSVLSLYPFASKNKCFFVYRNDKGKFCSRTDKSVRYIEVHCFDLNQRS